jgi:hypothetical protein
MWPIMIVCVVLCAHLCACLTLLEWVTPDLVQVMQNNAVLASGLRNPKCMAALELMQKNPAEAKARFGNDAEVNTFVMEFGRVMGSHFTGLGEKEKEAGTGGGAAAAPQQPKGPMISEVSPDSSRGTSAASSSTLGPLAKAAIDRQVSQQQNPLNVGSNEVSDKQVQEVLGDPELRQMLEDPAMQQILMECGEPDKFQQHMRNPETARKIQKLYKSGLVGTAK